MSLDTIGFLLAAASLPPGIGSLAGMFVGAGFNNTDAGMAAGFAAGVVFDVAAVAWLMYEGRRKTSSPASTGNQEEETGVYSGRNDRYMGGAR